jgi:methyl acetate hydrolase
MTRRQFGAAALALGAHARTTPAAGKLDHTLRASLAAHRVPAAVALVATGDTITYSGAFGKRDSVSGIPVTENSIFSIASMTKAITSAAALQLVERGALSLHDPVKKHLPELAKLEILEGFDSAGKARLRPAATPVTLHHLLTHTSGFAYDMWDRNLLRYGQLHSNPSLLDRLYNSSVWLRLHGETDPAHFPIPLTPLLFEPGARWQYGMGLDWTGRLIETISGMSLEEYFQRNIFVPLGMKDTSFVPVAGKFGRMVTGSYRQQDGSLKEGVRRFPPPPKFFSGGGGLTSTAPDYVRFLQMILRRGRGGQNQPILRPQTVDLMTSNQIGELSAGRLKTVRPDLSCDVDFHPGFADKWGYGFLINPTAYDHGRSAGSLAWAGIDNTFYWIDPQRPLCAVLLMQFLPFCDPQALGVLRDFERAVYS